MPSRFEVVPDVAADAALSLSDAVQTSQGWLNVVTVSFNGMVWDASARMSDAVRVIASNMTNGTLDTTEVLENATEWFSNQTKALGNASALASLANIHSRMTTPAKAALLLAVFVWLFRELLVRSTARALLRRHGHAHYA